MADKSLKREGDLQRETIETYANVLDSLPDISGDDIQVEKKPLAEGVYSKVYDAKWRDRDVAVKVVVSLEDIDEHIKEIRNEASLVIGLLHPNIIRVFGTTWVSDTQLGIVMEKAQHCSLKKWIGKMEHEGTAKIALGIIDGLEYAHSRQVVHRDLKPQNILMFGPEDDMIPKITDFGVSKVIRSLTMQTAIGTPLYMAPEVRKSSACDSSADVFSLAMMLFEMFSGQPPARHSSQPLTQHMFAVIVGKTSTISDSFPVPESLHDVIERGWNRSPEERPTLSEYRSALTTLVAEPTTETEKILERNVTTNEQADEMAIVNVALPVHGLSWNASYEVLNSKQLRSEMIDDIKAQSTMASSINESVLSAMNVVPRHLFIEQRRMGAKMSKQGLLSAAYVYNKPIPTTMNSNESSPEIIGTQLSMTEIIQGQSVLLLGIKGGYIQSLIAQLVGINGSIVTVTADNASMNVSRDRVNRFCPWKNNVEWIRVSNITDRGDIVAQLNRQKKLFHTIIYCGAVAEFPSEMKELLHSGGNVSIMAPVKEGEGVRFQLYLRRGKESELRTITDFDAVFEDAQ